MKFVLPLLIGCLVTLHSYGQCINGTLRLYPEVTTDYSLNYGKSVSMYDDYLAVGVHDSDTLTRESGIVYIYEKVNDVWKKIASMTASSPYPDMRFGINVKLSQNYLLVSAEGKGGQVYIFRKPASGWVTAVESVVLSATGTESFGTAYNHPVDISSDENTIVIADALQRHDFNPTTIAGTLYIYHKNAAAQWSNAIVPVQIKATANMIDFGRSGVFLSGNRLITGTPFTAFGFGNIFIYHDASGTFSNPSLEALLSPQPNHFIWMDNLAVMDDGIMVSASGNGQLQLMFFPKPASGTWVNAQAAFTLDPEGITGVQNTNFIKLATNGTDLYATSKTLFGVSYLTLLKKGSTGWSDPVRETIDSHSSVSTNSYGSVMASNQNTNVVAGFIAHPGNNTVHNALRTYSKSVSNTWIMSSLYSTSKSTRDHAYGTKMVGHDDFLFVSAIRDNTITADAGKVYIYKKNGLLWEPKSTINAPSGNAFSATNFGSALAVNDNFLAVGAVNWSPKGSFFIYKKNNTDWSNPQPFQQISIPDSANTVVSYGDNVAMDDRWLLIPYGYQDSGVDTKVAVYEYDGNSWVYRQSVSTGYFNFFSKFTTVGIAIEEDMFVASSTVFELNSAGKWTTTCELFPTDPETFRFAFPSFELITNGSYFGQAVAIKNGTVFIGAPRKDFQSTWDVGAVYVYKKQPGELWTSRTETGKIVPDVPTGNGLFGASISAYATSVIVGAPGSAVQHTNDLNNSLPNNTPGKAMLFDAIDPSWSSANLARTFTGETSVRDDFGGQVIMSQGTVFISASAEDTQTGRTSGSVYITDAPAEITAVRTMCGTDGGMVTLTANPPGGTWSGNGIVDTINGSFNPVVAGFGTHTITYTPSGCQASTANIRIIPIPAATLTVSPDIAVCEEKNEDVTLSVAQGSGYTYQWYYRENDNETFAPISSVTTNATTTIERGQYQAKVVYQGCENLSPIITVHNESMDLDLVPVDKVCGTTSGGIALQATPSGGTWSGPGVLNNSFVVTGGTVDGSYNLNYNYISPLGCGYNEEMIIVVELLKNPVIARAGNLCEEGSVSLSLNTALPGATYTWSMKELNGTSYEDVATGVSFEAISRGAYMVTVQHGDCQASSSAVTIVDNFTMSFFPEDERSEVCHANDFMFSLNSDPVADYQWLYSLDGQIYDPIPGSTSNSIHPAKTGYYIGKVDKGVCTFTTLPKYILIHSPDSLFVPNVFTPNGDPHNETFQITVVNDDDTESDAGFEVFNRYGKLIFSSPDNRPWHGDNTSPGTYFWVGTYETCEGKVVPVKGWVQVMK